MMDIENRLNIELMIYDILYRNHVEDEETLGRYEEGIHEIISNICCNYADDEKIEDYNPYF